MLRTLAFRLLAASAAATSCVGRLVAQAHEEQMVPEAAVCARASSAPTASKTLVVAPVTGQTTASSRMFAESDLFAVDNTTLQQAVADSMRRSGMFREVSTQGATDYELDTKVVSAKGTAAALGQLGKWTIYVNYRVVDVGSNRVVWQDDIPSEGTWEVFEEMPWSGHGPRTQGAGREAAMRNNLTLLVKELCAQLK